jgi:hypothetical protein
VHCIPLHASTKVFAVFVPMLTQHLMLLMWGMVCCPRYVEDADLWRWQVPHSRAFHAGLSGLNIDYGAASPQAAEAVFKTLQQLDPAAVVAQVGGENRHWLHGQDVHDSSHVHVK